MEKLKVYTAEMATSHLDETRIINQMEVTVATKKIPFAGTDARVYMDFGTLGKYLLNTAGEDDFEMGTIKTYTFETSFTLGDLRKTIIELGHDNSGKNPGWCVGGFRLQIKLQDSDILYLYKLWEDIGWLAKDKAPYYAVVAELQDGVL
jgi:hypothetical protein